MLSDAEKREVDHELGQYEHRQAAGIEALRVVQRHRGWVSDEGLADVGAYLDISTHALESVATFYNLVFRQPVGRHVILICDSVSCFVVGYDRLRAHLEKKLGIGLGQTTPDGRFTLLPVPCLGACDHAPALMIDDDQHHDLDPDVDANKIDQVLAQYQ